MGFQPLQCENYCVGFMRGICWNIWYIPTDPTHKMIKT